MERTDQSSGKVRDQTLAIGTTHRFVLRAWILMLAGFAVFLFIFLISSIEVYSYFRDGTQPQTALLEPVSGQGLLLRSAGEEDWRLVSESATVREGDTISTGSATAGWITLFDQSTVEVSENSLVRIKRMRTSRLFTERKEIEIEPLRGTIHVGMAPRGEFNTSSLTVPSGPVTIRMRDEIRSEQTGSFLVETQRLDPGGNEDDPILAVRVAVLRGQATVETDHAQQTLSTNEQVVVGPGGEPGEVTSARREHVRNGDFSRDLADWVEYHGQSGDPGTDSGTVQRVPTEGGSDSGVAVQFSRSTQTGTSWETGIQQTVGQSLRVHSSLNLGLDLRIDDQHPPGGGDEMTEFPLIVKINYVDLQGQNREWWHGFYVHESVAGPVPGERATRVVQGEWSSVSFDLSDLSPLPRQISSILVYSSGHNYRSFVTNLSLTSSEMGNYDEYD
ncbi:MAG: hypothetical protein WD401_03955 [Thermomicrobiaceae bacterium]